MTWGLEVCAAVDYTVTVAQPNVTVCASSNATYSIDIGQAGTYTDPVAISVTGLPAPAAATFSINPVTPTGSSVLTVSNLNTVSPGTYNLFLNTSSTSGPKVENLTLDILGTPGNTGLLTPADLASGVSTSVNFTWSAVSGAGITYEIEIATDPTFSSVVDNAVGLTTVNYNSTALSSGTTYYWRVRAVNSCATGSYASSFSFTTSNCTTIMSTDVPVAIPGVGTGSSVLNFPTTGVISDVNVIDVSGTHNRIQQIQVRVTSPGGTTAILWDRICANENDFNVSFDDAAVPGALPCPPIGGGTYQSQDALSAFNGEDPSGTWTLTIQDFNGNGASANLQTWGLEVCIATPTCSVSASAVSTSCNSGSDGIANSTPISGTGSYTFLWDNAETTQNISGLSAGSYTVTMTDALSCASVATASVTEPNILVFNISSTDESCSSSNGSITAIPTGGTTPYNYNWSSGGTSQTENNLNAGNYSITVTDVKSCSTTSSVTISNIAGPTATTSVTDASCGASNGTATVIPTGGTGAYNYAWSSGGAGSSEGGLASGSYSVTVTDAGTCSVVENVTVGDT
ncbi:proprotein convertase P-domain-containing protein, partial [bacterium]|nr:proprotein convertase P-domain-containing protein [bacterium]